MQTTPSLKPSRPLAPNMRWIAKPVLIPIPKQYFAMISTRSEQLLKRSEEAACALIIASEVAPNDSASAAGRHCSICSWLAEGPEYKDLAHEPPTWESDLGSNPSTTYHFSPETQWSGLILVLTCWPKGRELVFNMERCW
jgi:hypothetical protein